MTDRDRLIELIRQAKTEVVCYGEPATKWQRNIVDRAEANDLADYLLANGVVVSPLKRGDKIYKIFDIESIHRKIEKIEVLNIEIEFRSSCGIVKKKYLYNYNGFTNDDFGKTVFLTKEEAEAKLKELKNNG